MPVHRNESLYIGSSLTSPCSLSSVDVVFIYGDLLSLFGKQPTFLSTAKVFRRAQGTPMANNPIRCDPGLVLEVSFGDRRDQV